MLDFLLNLLPDCVKVWFGIKTDTAVRLGQAEEKSEDLAQSLTVANAEAQAVADAPTDKQSLVSLLKDHKASICFICLISLQLTSCADKVVNVCPKIRAYTPAQEDEIAANLSTLPPQSPLIAPLVEWSVLRAEARACQQAGS